MQCWRPNILLYFVFHFWLILKAEQNVTETVPTVSSSPGQNLTQIQNTSIPEQTNGTIDLNSMGMKQRMVIYSCTTPNGDEGFCMPIMKCPKLKMQHDNINAQPFLEESRCGTRDEDMSNPSVCCGKYSNFRYSENTSISEQTNSMAAKQRKNPLPETCGHQTFMIRARILGGKEAMLGEFPWLARLMHKNRKGTRVFGCSGFLISSKFVLTAAHCLESENNQILGPVYEVHLGEHDTKTKIDCNAKNTTCAEKVQVIRVNKSITHPSYNMTSRHHHHDIGLIYLKKGAKTSSYVSPICLFEKLNFEPFEYWLSGWGSTETENISNLKMKVSVPPFPHSNCTKQYKKLHVRVIDKQLCAGGKRNKDSCTGDSGGPLMLVVNGTNWFAAGVVSYGMGCGREGWPAIYTNITSYSEWIRNTMLTYQTNENTKTRKVQI